MLSLLLWLLLLRTEGVCCTHQRRRRQLASLRHCFLLLMLLLLLLTEDLLFLSWALSLSLLAPVFLSSAPVVSRRAHVFGWQLRTVNVWKC